jgi:hypothetical protein
LTDAMSQPPIRAAAEGNEEQDVGQPVPYNPKLYDENYDSQGGMIQ